MNEQKQIEKILQDLRNLKREHQYDENSDYRILYESIINLVDTFDSKIKNEIQ